MAPSKRATIAAVMLATILVAGCQTESDESLDMPPRDRLDTVQYLGQDSAIRIDEDDLADPPPAPPAP